MELEVFLDQFVNWAATRPDVAAFVLVGSHARRTATPNSDIDLVILCGFADGLLRADWPGLFGDVKSSWFEGFGALRSRRIAYRDGREAKFGIAERSWARVPLDSGTARVLGAGVRILYDPDEVAAKAIAAMNGSTDSSRMVQMERVILEGRFVRLEPISLDHVDARDPLAARSVHVEWRAAGDSTRLPWAGTRRGIEGVQAFSRELRRHMRYSSFAIREYVVGESRVAVVIEASGTARSTGRPFASPVLRLYDFSGRPDRARPELQRHRGVPASDGASALLRSSSRDRECLARRRFARGDQK